MQDCERTIAIEFFSGKSESSRLERRKAFPRKKRHGSGTTLPEKCRRKDDKETGSREFYHFVCPATHYSFDRTKTTIEEGDFLISKTHAGGSASPHTGGVPEEYPLVKLGLKVTDTLWATLR